MHLEYVKKIREGANFIVRPRAQNCLATPLVTATHNGNIMTSVKL